MNLYIRTLGFDNMTSEAEAKFIKTGIRESIKEGIEPYGEINRQSRRQPYESAQT